MDELLKIEHLSVGIQSPAGKVQAVRDVSFELYPGEVLAIVGESGCGKSMLCKSIMKLLPKSAGSRAAGSLQTEWTLPITLIRICRSSGVNCSL